MAEVNLNINGRSYPIACDDGQEPRIEALASYIDERLRGIAASGAASSENQLLMLTSLILADEIFELRDSLDVTQDIIAPSGQGSAAISDVEEEAIAQTLRSLSSRISMVSDRIKKM